MNKIDLIELGKSFMECFDQPTILFQDEDHAIYWLGIPEDTAFRCNAYLITDKEDALIVDPGGRQSFDFVKKRVSQVLPPENIGGMILCHQDPDVAASMDNWLEVNPALKVITSQRTNVLLPNYGNSNYSFISITDEPLYYFRSGRILRFIESPFLHFPGAFTTYDEFSRYLFSGDIWAAIDMEWQLVVENFSRHVLKLNLFHLDYMAGNIAARGFADRIRNLAMDAILPQHGSVIPGKFVPDALNYLSNLKCGVDLIYPHLKVK
jgi:flavorubredoxin